MYKVFYNNSVIFIGEKLKKSESNFKLVRVKNKKQTLRYIALFLKQLSEQDIWLCGYQFDHLFEDVKSCFQLEAAAGGLVRNDDNTYLFIQRLGIWDLPKGKMKKNESPQHAAIREVEEETGARRLSIQNELPSTYHIYPHAETYVLKRTYWYFMQTDKKQMLIPQQEEDITQAVWFDQANSKTALENSYRSLKENFLSFFQD